jgi:hypothetical protein
MRPFSVDFATAGIEIRRTAQVTKRYVAALKRNTWPVVTPQLIITATTTGPVTRDPFTDADDKLMEPPRSSGFTKPGSTAEKAGALNAFPIPTVICAKNNAHTGA